MSEYSLCQSCAMPFDDEHKKYIAKEKDGSDSVHCTYCYENGEFIDPHATVEDMVKLALPHVVRKMGDENSARKHITEVISGLSRWKKQE